MMVRGTFSELLAPGLSEVFHRAYDEEPSKWEQFFNTNSSTRAYEDDFSYGGFELFQQRGELEDLPVRDARPGFTTRYVHRTWANGYKLSRELIDDEMYGVTREFPALLARSARATKESTAAAIFNLGFSASYPGGDAKALFATDHPLYSGGLGTTWSNTFASTTPLSHTALKDAIIQMKRTKADDNIFTPFVPRVLLVPDDLYFKALEIVGTERVPYSADNTTNVVAQQGLQVVAWSYLTDTDAWFLAAPKAQTKLKYYSRWEMTESMEDVERNLSMVHRAFYRCSFGWSDAMGVFGANGS